MPIFLPPERWIDIERECAAVWQDLDLNNYRCPANTVGVMVAQQMPAANERRNNFGIRKNGSTDTGNRVYRASGTRTVDAQAWKVAVTGCDANKIIETYLTTNHTPTVRDKIWIIGWFLEGEAVFFDNFELPDDAGWRAAWVDDKTWYELDMSSVEPPGGPPTAYIFNQYNGHWGSANYVLLPSGRQTGPEGALNNARFYETHGTFHVCPPGANNNVAFVTYATSANIEVQVIGYLTPQSGFTDVGNMIARINTPGGDGFTYASRALADYITVPDNTVAFSLYTKTGAGGCIGGSREHNPRSSIQFSEGYGNYGGPPILNTDAGNLFDVSGKWQDFVVLGVYTGSASTTPQAPDYPNRSDFVNDPVSVDLSTDWVDADPDGFTVDQLPEGLSMTPQGVVTGTPTTVAVTTVTVTNLGAPGGGGAVIDRPEGALFYDDFFQYDARQSVEGVDITSTYGTWRLPTYPALQLAPPDLVSNTLQRPSGQDTAAVASYYAPPLDVCIAFTISGMWKNPDYNGSEFSVLLRQATDSAACYRLFVSPSFNTSFDIRIVRFIASGASTNVGQVLTNTQPFANGDRIRWEIAGTYHNLWYKRASSGIETLLLSFDDTDGAGAAPGNTPGELVLHWDKIGAARLCPISDFGIWPAGEFVEPSVQTAASFDWTIAAKPTLACENIAAESYVQTTRVFSPDGWSNVVSASFAVPLWSNVAGGSFTPQNLVLAVDNIAAESAIDPVSITTQYTLEVASISAVSSLDPVGITSQHTVEAASIAAASAITPVSITSQHVVEAASLAAASAITPVSISTQYRLEVASVAAASAVDPVGVTSQHFVGAASIAAASYLTEVRLPSEALPLWSNVASDSFVLVPDEQRLTVDNIASAGHITPVAVDTEHHLTVADVAAESHVDPVSLATEGRLGVASIAAKSHITPVRVIHTQRLVATSAAAASHIDPVSLSTSFRLEVASVAATSYVAPVAVSPVHLINVEDIRAGPHLDPVAISSTQWLQVDSVAADSYVKTVIIEAGNRLLPVGYKPVMTDVSDIHTVVYTGDAYVIMNTGGILRVADVTDTLSVVNI